MKMCKFNNKTFCLFDWFYRDNTTAPSIDEVTTQEIDARVCKKLIKIVSNV